MNKYFLNIDEMFKTFGELFRQEGITNLPDISIVPNSSLGILVSGMSANNIAVSGKDSVAKVIETVFNSFIDYVVDNNNITRTETLSIVSTKLATTLENAFNVMTEEIAPEVEALAEKIAARYNDLVKKAGAVELGDSTVTEDDFMFLRWNKLGSKVLQDTVIEEACKNAGYPNAALSSVNVNNIVGKANFGPIKNVSVEDEEVLDLLKTKLSSKSYGMTNVSIENCWEAVTDNRAYVKFVNNLKAVMTETKNVAANTLTILSVVNDMDIFVNSALTVIVDKLSSNVLSDIKANVDAVKKTIIAAKYWCLVNKEIKFKGMMVFPGNILVESEYNKFVAEGGSVQQIYDFIRTKFADNSVPELGLSRKVISDSDIQLEIAAHVNSVTRKNTYIRTKALIDAYMFECKVYVKERKTEVDPVIYEAIIDAEASDLQGNLGKLQDTLYDVILGVFYRDSLVKHLYKYLQKSFKNMFSEEETVEQTDILEYEYKAAVEILVDYLFDRLVQKKELV